MCYVLLGYQCSFIITFLITVYISFSNISRQQIWKDNTIAIETHNKLADEGQYKFWLKMNYFGDLVGIQLDVKILLTSNCLKSLYTCLEF